MELKLLARPQILDLLISKRKKYVDAQSDDEDNYGYGNIDDDYNNDNDNDDDDVTMMRTITM